MITQVRYFGAWNALTGAFGALGDRQALQAMLKHEPGLKYVAKVGDGLPIARLHYFAAAGHPESLGLLLDSGFEVDDVCADTPHTERMWTGGYTPLFHALVNQSLACAHILCRYGASVARVGWSGQHALHVTAAKSHHAVTQWILEHGVCPNMQDEHGETPAHAAARRCVSPRSLALLHSFGARFDIANEEGLTPLEVAAKAHKTRLYKWMESHAG